MPGKGNPLVSARQPDSHIEFAGDYFLKYIHLRNHAGEGINRPTGETLKGEDINLKVIEFNIYESIFSSSVTGSAVGLLIPSPA
jgi:hypothetical protein